MVRKEEKKKITVPASHQTVEGYNLRQWRCLLSGEIRGFTRKPHIYKTLLDVPTARLVSKPHSSGATFNCSMSTRMERGKRRGEKERQAEENTVNVFDADELAYGIILCARPAGNNSSCI